MDTDALEVAQKDLDEAAALVASALQALMTSAERTS